MITDNNKIYRIEQFVDVDVRKVETVVDGKKVICNKANQIVLDHIVYAVRKMIEEHPTAELNVRMDVDWYHPIYPCYKIIVEGKVWGADK